MVDTADKNHLLVTDYRPITGCCICYFNLIQDGNFVLDFVRVTKK